MAPSSLTEKPRVLSPEPQTQLLQASRSRIALTKTSRRIQVCFVLSVSLCLSVSLSLTLSFFFLLRLSLRCRNEQTERGLYVLEGTLSTLVDKEATRKIIFLLFLKNIQIFIFFDYFILLKKIF